MDEKYNIDERLRHAILTAGFSRYRLSKLSGVAEGVISRFMNRDRDVMLTTAAKLAATLGLVLTPTKRARKGR